MDEETLHWRGGGRESGFEKDVSLAAKSGNTNVFLEKRRNASLAEIKKFVGHRKSNRKGRI